MNTCDRDGQKDDHGVSVINANIPRRVHFDKVSLRILIPMLIVLMVGIMGGAWISSRDIRAAHLLNILRREGRVTYGTVTKSSPIPNGAKVEYSFSVDGISYSGQAVTKTDHYDVPEVGGRLHIWYLPGNPHINLPTRWEWFSAWDIYSDIFLLFLMGVAGVVISVSFRERTLARMGIVVEGRVTGCAPNGKLVKVYYEFNTEDNGVIEGSREMPEAREFGASIMIIYLRHNPKRNGIYPLGGFRIAE